jgi:hypothetical protein
MYLPYGIIPVIVDATGDLLPWIVSPKDLNKDNPGRSPGLRNPPFTKSEGLEY